MTLILSGTDGLSDVDGSAATPAIRGTDANTGMFFPAADTIAFSEGGVEAMRLDSAGNVGIGTSSPDSLSNFRFLDVGSSGTNQGIVQTNNGTVKTAIYSSGTDGYVSTRTAHNLNFQTNGSTRATIDTNGNLSVTGTVTGTNLFGQSQTWTNVTGSRATGTTYTNSTGRPIMVVVTPVPSGSLIGTFNISGSAVGLIQFTPSGGGGGSPFFYIIPNGVTYSVTNNSNFSISYWWELR
jgi:hypothetical protein